MPTVRPSRQADHERHRLAVRAVPGPDGAPIPVDPDVADAWFEATLPDVMVDPGAAVVLRVDGLATLAEVSLDGQPILATDSMFLTHEVPLAWPLRGPGRLRIRCRALTPELPVGRKPRARWRTRLVRDNDLRWVRTSLLGRAPGYAPGPPAVGPWQPIWLEVHRRVAVDALHVRTGMDGTTGVLRIVATLRALGDTAISAAEVVVSGPSGRHAVTLPVADGASVAGELRIPDVATWWPHSHGRPDLHDVVLRVHVATGDPVEIDGGRVGFRTIAAGPQADHDLAVDGLDLHVNGVRVFARGAVWTPLPDDDPADLDATLGLVVAAGMNMLRIPGIGRYESAAFHERCDELGILVWQDAAFANLDYPFGDPDFAATCRQELEQLMDRIAGRPSTVVVCGNSEIEQQVAMLGLPPEVWRAPFFAETLPSIVADAGSDAIVVPSAPFGGERPFVPGQGIANYYGVGGYRRPLEDARLAGVRFAAECLAFSNVPDTAAIERILPDAPAEVVVHHPAWKAAVPRDNGSGWDFEDVRDHYLAASGIDPVALRRTDHARYLERSRAITGEVMAAVFGEWRRPASGCHGGLVLWLRDERPGAGWGLLDDRGAPKVAYHHLRRALAPVAVWLTDEGLAGVAVHIANDRPDGLDARLRIAAYRDGEVRVATALTDVVLAAHQTRTLDVETLIGHFMDASYAYRFGPPGHDLLVASLEVGPPEAIDLLSQGVLFPVGRPQRLESAAEVGLSAVAESGPDGSLEVVVASRRVLDGVRLDIPGWTAVDDAFPVEPGGSRRVRLDRRADAAPDGPGQAGSGRVVGWLTALNLTGRTAIPLTGGDA